MSQEFDPYHRWLGIAPKDQPPNHYRLLGLSPFESDVEVIHNAADQRMRHVREFAIGKHSEHSQRILNEISRAKICLLDSAKREEYDAEIRVKLGIAPRTVSPLPDHESIQSAEFRLPPPFPVTPFGEADALAASTPRLPQPVQVQGIVSTLTSPTAVAALPMAASPLVAPAAADVQSSRPAEPANDNESFEANPAPQLLLAGALCAGIIGLCIAAAFVFRGRADNIVADVTSTHSATAVETVAAATADRLRSIPAKPKVPSPPLQIWTMPISTAADETPQDADRRVWRQAQQRYVPPAESLFKLDWLSDVDVAMYSRSPGWKADAGTLVSSAGPGVANLYLPGVLPEEFILQMDVIREYGEEPFYIGLTGPGFDFNLAFDHPHGDKWCTGVSVHGGGSTWSGIQQFELEPNQVRRLSVWVHWHATSEARVAVLKSDHFMIISQPLQEYEHSPAMATTLPEGYGLTLATASAFRIQRMTVRPIERATKSTLATTPASPAPSVAKTPTVAPTPSVAPATSTPLALPPGPPPALGDVRDLSSDVSLPEDAIRGDWQRDATGSIANAVAPQSVLRLRGARYERYRLDVVAERIGGADALILGLWIGGRRMHLVADGYARNDPPLFGFELVDGLRMPQRPEARQLQRRCFGDNRLHRITCLVEPAKVRVLVDGEQVLALDPLDPRYDGVPEEWQWIETSDAYVATNESAFRFHSITLTSPAGLLPETVQPAPRKPAGLTAQVRLPSPEAKEVAVASRAWRAKFDESIRQAVKFDRAAECADQMRLASQQPDLSLLDQFTLLRDAGTLAIEHGAPHHGVVILSELSERFEIPKYGVQRTALLDLFRSGNRDTAVEYQSIYLQLGEDALRDGDVKMATQLAEDATSLGAREKVDRLARIGAYLRRRIEEYQASFARIEQRFPVDPRTLASPDPSELEAFGLYLAFGRGDWHDGMLLLRGSTRLNLSRAADLELAYPVDAQLQLLAADTWWAFAEEERGRIRQQARARARNWYSAIPHDDRELLPSTVDRIRSRLRSITGEASSLPTKTNVDLKKILLDEVTKNGPWKLEQKKLRIEGPVSGVLADVGVAARGDYNVFFVVQIEKGDGAVTLSLPVEPERAISVVIDRERDETIKCSLQGMVNPPLPLRLAPRKESIRMRLEVTREGPLCKLRVMVDEMTFNWSGPASMLIAQQASPLVSPRSIAIGVERTNITVLDFTVACTSGDVIDCRRGK